LNDELVTIIKGLLKIMTGIDVDKWKRDGCRIKRFISQIGQND